MRQRDLAVYLHDIVEAAHHLAAFTAGKTLAQYEQDLLLRSAVERQFLIVGEALTQALRAHPAIRERISNPGQIVAFRNILVHGYAAIANDIVWAVLQDDLPVLCQEAELLLRDLETGP